MTTPVYKDPTRTYEDRAADLVACMTLDEKIAQVTGAWNTAKLFLTEALDFVPEKASEMFPYGIGQIGRIFHGLSAVQMAQGYNAVQKHFVENTRLGIPVMMHEECLHGVMEYDAISFPHPIALAGSFNPELVERIYAYTARDARARGSRQALTPVLDVCRDPRWGRTEETFGEDPYLVSRMGLAAVRGLQGGSTSVPDDKVIATLKHFAAHGQPEDGTNAGPANYSERVIREVFLSPFKAAVIEGKAMSVMASYNEIDGVPSHASTWLLKQILREEWGFTGSVVSDYYAIEQLEERHHLSDNKKDTARLSLAAGIDIELPEANVYPYIKELIAEDPSYSDMLDQAVYRIVYAKFLTKLFDEPYVDPAHAECLASDTEAVELSYTIATQCITLLKNDNAILPIDTGRYRRVALIGPNADYHSIGGYSCPNRHFTTIRQGLEDALAGHAELVYHQGCGITTPEGSWFVDEVVRTDESEDRMLIGQAAELAAGADIIVLCLGGNEQTTREAWKETHLGDRPSLDLVGLQTELYERMLCLGKPIIVVLSHGSPLSIVRIHETASAIVDCWYLGQETGRAVADMLLGNICPSAKLPISYPRSAGHIPVFYNHKPNARRGYLFDDISPLYPFGYGLSYTQFSITDLSLDQSCVFRGAEDFTVNLTVTNTGTRAGSEVVQIYVRDLVSSVTRPVKELKAFRKVELQPGQSVQLSISVPLSALAFYDISMRYIVEPGQFAIMAGNSSRDEDLQTVLLTVV